MEVNDLPGRRLVALLGVLPASNTPQNVEPRKETPKTFPCWQKLSIPQKLNSQYAQTLKHDNEKQRNRGIVVGVCPKG